ncbi:MAG TPA: biopolymer transporter ExbB [Sulfurospirillum sp. UBA12182]|nr:MAG TPA: biopolymer transporter ExbB [Sulfurospirillum sp. UBA12182]
MILAYINQGGVIAWILLVMGIFGISISIYKTIQFAYILKHKQKHLLLLAKQIQQHNIKEKSEFAKEYINSFINKKESGLPTIRIVATISPLLGLLGTVIGILLTFETISQSGLEDAKLFADGIALALITTIIGLIVSIPHYIAYNYLVHQLDSLQIEFEKEFLLHQKEIA